MLQLRRKLHESLCVKNESKEEGEGMKGKREFIKLHRRKVIC